MSETPHYYSNVMQAHMGPYDILIVFGRKEPEQMHSGNFSPQCEVSMSLAHAKIMLPILAKMIAEYESQFGPIPAPGYDEKARE